MEDDIFVLPQFHEVTSDDSHLDNSLNAENVNRNSTLKDDMNADHNTLHQRKRLKKTLIPQETHDPDEPESDYDNETVAEIKVRRCRRKAIKSSKELLHLKCEWRQCDYESENLDNFVLHVSHHIPHLRLRFNEENEEVFVCDWKGCDYETGNPSEVVRHVNFHSFHTKLKCIGSNLKNREKLPTCQYSSDNPNILPDFTEQMDCMWDNCTRKFSNIQTFHYHIIAHVNALPPGNNLPVAEKCRWEQCTKSYFSRHHLLNHMKKHTHAKVVGCPDCGSAFCSNTKFRDHCQRRISSEVQDYQCSHCSKFYSTERILRDHMISHINHHKCPFCDMTCPYEYTLAAHIRNKHIPEKPFKCQMCDYSCKTQTDLKKHLYHTHETEPLRCLVADCDFQCKRNITLQRHYTKIHCGEPFRKYACHVCHHKYNHGEWLTKHLIQKHDFHWPPGFSRFRYKQDEDGFYRLQTVRYESIEVTQAMLETESNLESCIDENKCLRLGKIEHTSTGAKLRIELDSGEEESVPQSEQETANAPNERVIAIEELDADGNVVNTSTVIEEISSLPLEGILIDAATHDS